MKLCYGDTALSGSVGEIHVYRSGDRLGLTGNEGGTNMNYRTTNVPLSRLVLTALAIMSIPPAATLRRSVHDEIEGIRSSSKAHAYRNLGYLSALLEHSLHWPRENHATLSSLGRPS